MRITNLAVLLTDKCNAACKMCCFSCSPRGQQVLDKETVFSYIQQASEIETVKNISFSGGEAIIYYDLLKECMEYALSFGLYSTLVTNGFWAADIDKGYKQIAGLVRCGLRQMSISVDKFHQEFVSVHTVNNAMTIAQSLNIMSAITMADLKDSENSMQAMSQLRPNIYNKDLIIYPVFPAGAATEHILEDKLIKVASKYEQKCNFDHAITLLFDGTILMCCSQFSKNIPITHLGRVGETTLKEAISNISSNDFTYVLLKKGFNWFVDLVENTLKKPLEDKYSVSCHLCHTLFSDAKLVEMITPYVKKEANNLRTRSLLGIQPKTI